MMQESGIYPPPGEGSHVSKKSYKKPTLTTFGSVAALTLSGGCDRSDGLATAQGGTFHPSNRHCN